jgi:hypothetical protein
LAPRGAIVVSFVDDFSSDPVVVDVAPAAGMPVDGVVALVVAPVDGVVVLDAAPVDGVVADGVSAALGKAPAMPIVETINPETSLLLSRRIIVRSFGLKAAAWLPECCR